jgi:hypothetical protein
MSGVAAERLVGRGKIALAGFRSMTPNSVLTWKQRLFWAVAIGLELLLVVLLTIAAWPSGACGCGG